MAKESFKKQFISGIIYTAAAKYIGVLVSLCVTAILSRILSPEEFGVVAIATIFINFFSLISTMGISPAIVQNKDLKERDIEHIYSLTFWLGVILSVLFWVVTPHIAAYYKNEMLRDILSVLTVSIFFSVLNTVPNALLLKEKEFKFIAYRTLSVQTAIGAIAVAGAFCGAGLYSLLVNPVLGSAFLFAITYRKRPICFRLKFKRCSVNKIFSYSLYQMLFNMTSLFTNNIDKLLMGNFFGAAALGYYEKSYRLMRLPLDNIGHVISPVLQPLFSEHQNDKDYLMRKYYALVSFLNWVGFLLSPFLFFTAKELVVLIFGKQWGASVASFQILTIAVAFIVSQSPIEAIFRSANNTKGLFLSSLIGTVVMMAAVILGLRKGTIEWVAFYVVFALFVAFIVYNIVLHKAVFRKPMWEFLKLFIKPLLAGALLALSLSALDSLIHLENLMFMFLSKGVIMTVFVCIAYISGQLPIIPIKTKTH